VPVVEKSNKTTRNEIFEKKKIKREKNKRKEYLDSVSLVFFSLKKLRDFSADRVGDSLHSLVFREDSRAIG
jgi:hypothetical protein